MNEVGGMEKFWMWVEYSNNLTFKMRKMGHCMFHDLINNNGITVAVIEVIPGWGSAKPTDKGFALTSLHSSPAGYKSTTAGAINFKANSHTQAPDNQPCTYSYILSCCNK